MLLPIDDPSRVAEARRKAAELAREAGCKAETTGRVEIVATELATNILKHASRGEMALSRFADAEGEGVQLLALDQGRGINDVQKCLADGYSTAGSLGRGLGAVQRLSDIFGMYSKPGLGTAVLARVQSRAPAANRFLVGAVEAACPGETVCGDGWSAVQRHFTADLLLTDGTGHGAYAADAAQAAVAAFQRHWEEPIEEVVAALHRALRPTRGASVAVARLEPQQGHATYCAVGNIAGTIVTGAESRKLVSYNGVAGHGAPMIRSFQVPFGRSSMAILHSDGLSTRWDLGRYPGLSEAHPAIVAGVLARDHRRGRDDASVVVIRPEMA